MFEINDIQTSGIGIYFKRGALLSELMKLPDPKPSYSYDWGDEHGIEYDDSAPMVFAPLQYDVTVYITANSPSALMDVRTALLNILSDPAGFSLNVLPLEREYKLRYKGSSGTRLISPIYSNGQQWCEIGLKLENNFDEVRTMLYLADMNGLLAATSDDELILVTDTRQLF
ncbi:hypothetical protein EDC17_101162 [Sphingobacterium alimentarium]|uniref:Uncharacterized protein n=1 Tax=Sphingobacterium alimentarium TaxID=797292 RepID=A0A4R3VUG0_9SPHI|nr:hypothetical protein [Sphingobacterium alimentarium]TCV17143.1 hypothetical protein EDC17_101162 [Sphingobacterium alimentarium]